MLESVFMMFREYMDPSTSNTDWTVERLAEDLFRNDDWKDIHGAFPQGPPLRQVIRDSFIGAWNHHKSGANSGAYAQYSHRLVHFNGELDRYARSHQYQPDAGKSVGSFIDPLFAEELWDPQIMDIGNWDSADETQIASNIRSLAEPIARLVQHCPYLMERSWPLAFISLFYWDTQIKDLVAESEFDWELLDDGDDRHPTSWASRVQDRIIYTYLDECEWENRCMDEVWTTYVETQLLIARHLESGSSNDPDEHGNDDERHGPSDEGNESGNDDTRHPDPESSDDPDEDDNNGARQSSKPDKDRRPQARADQAPRKDPQPAPKAGPSSAREAPDNGEGPSKPPRRKVAPKAPYVPRLKNQVAEGSRAATSGRMSSRKARAAVKNREGDEEYEEDYEDYEEDHEEYEEDVSSMVTVKLMPIKQATTHVAGDTIPSLPSRLPVKTQRAKREVGYYRVRARNARIRAMRRTHLMGTRNNEAAQPRTIAITV
ncbi:hypothetical protein OPT61_g3608 [Boeremia exigua]|uniref:Uncharacterized protein n=1 Tax=Boeremia exigua TaxID=749465 RepID=A0ACC2IH68_9PLEO|nr:hypothetical protein OPT61_g3608 [Boeremia exigua]